MLKIHKHTRNMELYLEEDLQFPRGSEFPKGYNSWVITKWQKDYRNLTRNKHHVRNAVLPHVCSELKPWEIAGCVCCTRPVSWFTWVPFAIFAYCFCCINSAKQIQNLCCAQNVPWSINWVWGKYAFLKWALWRNWGT